MSSKLYFGLTGPSDTASKPQSNGLHIGSKDEGSAEWDIDALVDAVRRNVMKPAVDLPSGPFLLSGDTAGHMPLEAAVPPTLPSNNAAVDGIDPEKYLENSQSIRSATATPVATPITTIPRRAAPRIANNKGNINARKPAAPSSPLLSSPRRPHPLSSSLGSSQAMWTDHELVQRVADAIRVWGVDAVSAHAELSGEGLARCLSLEESRVECLRKHLKDVVQRQQAASGELVEDVAVAASESGKLEEVVQAVRATCNALKAQEPWLPLVQDDVASYGTAITQISNDFRKETATEFDSLTIYRRKLHSLQIACADLVRKRQPLYHDMSMSVSKYAEVLPRLTNLAQAVTRHAQLVRSTLDDVALAEDCVISGQLQQELDDELAQSRRSIQDMVGKTYQEKIDAVRAENDRMVVSIRDAGTTMLASESALLDAEQHERLASSLSTSATATASVREQCDSVQSQLNARTRELRVYLESLELKAKCRRLWATLPTPILARALSVHAETASLPTAEVDAAARTSEADGERAAHLGGRETIIDQSEQPKRAAHLRGMRRQSAASTSSNPVGRKQRFSIHLNHAPAPRAQRGSAVDANPQLVSALQQNINAFLSRNILEIPYDTRYLTILTIASKVQGRHAALVRRHQRVPPQLRLRNVLIEIVKRSSEHSLPAGDRSPDRRRTRTGVPLSTVDDVDVKEDEGAAKARESSGSPKLATRAETPPKQDAFVEHADVSDSMSMSMVGPIELS